MELLLKFHPIYLIFPIILIFSCMFKNTKMKAVILTILFIFIFICAETGPDYEGYEKIYNKCMNRDVHGEIGFILLCRLFYFAGIPYNWFRVIFLSSFAIMFCLSLYKLTNNFSLSFLLAYLIYVVYFVSAYRQFATMAILLFTLYLFFHKKQVIWALLLNFVAIFIHKLAIIQFLMFAIFGIYQLCAKEIKPLEKSIIKKYFFQIIIVACALRLFLYLLLSYTSLGTIYSECVNYPELSLINEGLLSRLVVLVFVTHYYIVSSKDRESGLIYSFYFICMMLYVIFPSELIMGRLMNNIKLLEIILIPSLMFKQYGNIVKDKEQNKKMLRFSQIVIICVIGAVFVSQMTNQDGYSNYNHMLLEVLNGL